MMYEWFVNIWSMMHTQLPVHTLSAWICAMIIKTRRAFPLVMINFKCSNEEGMWTSEIEEAKTFIKLKSVHEYSFMLLASISYALSLRSSYI